MSEDYIGLDDLKNSIAPMTSDDWVQRFIAEYAQLVTRINSLLEILFESEEDRIAFNCPVGLLDMQYEAMDEYKKILEIRADIYGIDLEKEIEKLNR
jgi:hypothetical protein